MSTNQGRIRVIRAANILSELVTLGETFRVGLPFNNELIASTDFKKFGLSNAFKKDESQIPKAAGPRTRTNLKGLIVRKQPEEKQEVKRHIEYRRKKDGSLVKI
jgi:hypothetical protein